MPRDEREREKNKPVIKSNIQIKASTSKVEEDYSKNKERERIRFEKGEGEFDQDLFDAIPDMSIPLKGNMRDEPHPHWLGIQTVRSPRSPRSSLSVPEEEEILDYVSDEDWDLEEGNRRRRVRPQPLVSKINKLAKPIIKDRDETKQISKVNVEDLIKKKVAEKVDSFLKEHSKLNESINSHINLTVEVIEKYSGTNRIYKLTTDSKFDMFDDYLKSELRTKNLHYIVSDEQIVDVSEDKITNDKHKVRDIIINHIDEKYYAKILDIKEPSEILNKLKEYIRLVTRVTSVSARNDLYEMRFNPKRERQPNFGTNSKRKFVRMRMSQMQVKCQKKRREILDISGEVSSSKF